MKLKQLNEGWEELGIKDPELKSDLDYYGKDVINQAPKTGELENNNEKYEKMRKHSMYIKAVFDYVNHLREQIKNIQKFKTEALKFLEPYFYEIKEYAKIIAEDIGLQDFIDIALSIEDHPLALNLIKIRDDLAKRYAKK